MKKIYLILAIFSFLSFVSCKKNGLGGGTTIIFYPEHNLDTIRGASVYIKFNASEVPTDPTKNFDLKIVGKMDEPYIRVEGLRIGTYSFYIQGYDSLTMQNISGSSLYKILWQERKREIGYSFSMNE